MFVVDDDVSVRESLESLIRRRAGPETFATAQDFPGPAAVHGPSCLVLDVDLRTSAASTCRGAWRRPADMPIIFITGYGDVPMTVQAMKAGAVEFLTKPFGDEVLLGAIQQRVERSRAALARRRRCARSGNAMRPSAAASAK